MRNKQNPTSVLLNLYKKKRDLTMLLSHDVSVGTLCPLQHYVCRHIMSDVTKGSPFPLYYVRRFEISAV